MALRRGLSFHLVDIAVLDLSHHIVPMKKIIPQVRGHLAGHNAELIANHCAPRDWSARRNQVRAPLKHEFRVPEHERSEDHGSSGDGRALTAKQCGHTVQENTEPKNK